MTDYVRVTDDVKPSRSFTIPARRFDSKIHKLVESDRDPALDRHGDIAPPKYRTTASAEAAKKKKAAETSAAPSGQQAETERN